MRFDLAYCNQAVCAPSRFTLMLGSHSTSTGLYGLGSRLRESFPDAVTLPQHFSKHGGYRTESLGKIFHIGHGNEGDPKSFVIPHFKDKVIEYLDSESTEGGQLTREEALFTNQKLGQIRSLPRGAAFESPIAEDEDYADGRVAAETIARLRSATQRREKEGKPFFIAAGFVRPHLPFSAPQRYWKLHNPNTLPLPAYTDLPKGAPAAAGKRKGEICAYKPVPENGEINEDLARQLIHGYYASTSFVDAQIGKVLDAVDELGLTENTIIVLWGDHGFHLGDLGIWTKHTNYEQANRIPLIISAPGITQPNTATKQLAESVDLFPTLAELAKLPAPKGPQPIDGISLVPVLKDPSTRVRDHAYHAYPKAKLGRAIRTERYRLVEWRGRNDAVPEYELYDYDTDPLERENLVNKHPDVASNLKAILATHPEPVLRKRGNAKHTPVKQTDRTRLVILADMGNEPDEEQQMAHMLINCNEFDLEGLIAVSGKFLHADSKRPERRRLWPDLFHKLIDAYGKVLPNLKLHADGWPSAEYLHSITKSGQKRFGTADVGDGKSTEGSKFIMEALRKDDPRPIWIVINAGSNTLAQALYDLRQEEPDNLAKYVAKLRVYENGAQDNAGAWICSEFPSIHWIRSNYQTYAYGGPGQRSGNTRRGIGPHFWKPFAYSVQGQHDWLKQHARESHGALGDAYPERRFHNGQLGFMEGGGTIPWLGLVNKGLFDINEPSWGGWSGRFTADKVANFWSRHADIKPDEEKVAPFHTYREASDVWTDPDSSETYHGDYVPVWRWRPAMYANFICRMDWCVKPFEEANHHPIAALNDDASNTIVVVSALAGEQLSFDASASRDPDGDKLNFRWWQYQEAGTYSGQVHMESRQEAKTIVHVPTGAAGKQIHVILEVCDENTIASLHDYRRIVINVKDEIIALDSTQK